MLSGNMSGHANSSSLLYVTIIFFHLYLPVYMKSLCSDHPLGWQEIITYHTNVWEQDECSFNHLLRFLEQLNSALDPFTGLKCSGNESGLCDHWSQTAKMEMYSDLHVSFFKLVKKSTQNFSLKSSVRAPLTAEGQFPFLFCIFKKKTNYHKSNEQKQIAVFSDTSPYMMFDCRSYYNGRSDPAITATP